MIPTINFASERVICMSFEEGKYITVEGAIKNMGLKEADVAKLISKIFCEQIYRWKKNSRF